jgi:hypothetical protein
MAATAESPATGTDQQIDLSTIPVSPDGETSKPDNDKPITVFHDKDNFNVKHPLQNKWTLWFTKPPSGKVGGSRRALPRTQWGLWNPWRPGVLLQMANLGQMAG